MANPYAAALHALALRSTDSSGDGFNIGAGRSALALEAVVTTCTGELLLQIETSPDNSTGWRVLGQICRTSAIGKFRAWFLDCDQYVRVLWNVGTSATFSVAGHAYTVYAHREDLEDCLPTDVVEQADSEDLFRIPRALIKGASHVEAKIGTAHSLPLTEWQPVLSQANAWLAAYAVLVKHRLHGGGAEELVSEAFKQADAWLGKIQRSEVVLPNATPDTAGVGPQLLSGDPLDPTEYRELWSHSFGTYRSDF